MSFFKNLKGLNTDSVFSSAKDMISGAAKRTADELSNRMLRAIGIDDLNGIGMKLVFSQNLPKESDVRAIPPPVILDEGFLREVVLCAKLSDLVYEESEKRVYPENSGMVIFERKNVEGEQIPFFIMKNDQKKLFYLVCRGSWTFNDVKIDIKGKPVEYNGGYVHKGVFAASTFVFDTSYQILQHLLVDYPDYRILVTGHSLGAGAASLVTMMMKLNCPTWNTYCICFAPPPVVSHNLHIQTQQFVTSLIFEKDPVPYLSLKILTVMNISDSINNYVANNVKADLVPPGNMLHIRNEPNTTRYYVGRIEDMNYFAQLIDGLNESDHFMTKYIAALETFFDRV